MDHLNRWYLLGRIFAPQAFRKYFFSGVGPTAVVAMLAAWPLVGPVALVFPLIAWAFLIVVYRATDRCFYGAPLPPAHQFAGILLDLGHPLLWLRAASARSMVWRGRMYRLDRAGRIEGSLGSPGEL